MDTTATKIRERGGPHHAPALPAIELAIEVGLRHGAVRARNDAVAFPPAVPRIQTRAGDVRRGRARIEPRSGEVERTIRSHALTCAFVSCATGKSWDCARRRTRASARRSPTLAGVMPLMMR